jgi:hypothetical protein
MAGLKKIVTIASICVFLICLYCFLLGNKVFERKFENDVISWYFLAKGIFCSLALFLLIKILENMSEWGRRRARPK